MPTYTIEEFHQKTGIPLRTLYYRIKKGIFEYPGAELVEEKAVRFRIKMKDTSSKKVKGR